jgi:predicted membrane protein
MKNPQKNLDWLLVLLGLFALFLFFYTQRPILSKINFIAIALIPVINFIKNKTYKIIGVIIGILMITYSYFHLRGLI